MTELRYKWDPEEAFFCDMHKKTQDGLGEELYTSEVQDLLNQGEANRLLVEKQRVAVEAARRVIAITTINNAARLLIRDLHLAIVALDQPEAGEEQS